MTKKQQPPSLADIRKLFQDNNKSLFSFIEERLRANDQIILAAFDRDIRLLEGRLNSLETKVDKGFDEVNRRFDINDDTHQEILQVVSEMTDKKIKDHERQKHIFSTVN
ncbi:MAG: hypothetical protein M1484_03200 [Patescibacteria group bacterium]|nr:hypothetical protein [Patescibacteria group bacterium]MCL5432069.1 hypothetical protein [Patescibacteria group bacterium]